MSTSLLGFSMDELEGVGFVLVGARISIEGCSRQIDALD